MGGAAGPPSKIAKEKAREQKNAGDFAVPGRARIRKLKHRPGLLSGGELAHRGRQRRNEDRDREADSPSNQPDLAGRHV